MPRQTDPKYQAMVEDSCGCAFCDCGDPPVLIEGERWHIIDDDIYGNAGPMPCTWRADGVAFLPDNRVKRY